MKVLVAPMAAMAETSGPFSRSSALCKALLREGHQCALCAALDVNYRPLENVFNYPAPIPSPLGLPGFLGMTAMRLASRLGIQQKKEVCSFEQVLFFSGALNQTYFSNDVAAVRQAIQDYKPDILYSEFRLSAIAAAKLESCKIAAGFSFPVQKSYAADPGFSKKARETIRQLGLPQTESILELFEWADLRIVPSTPELEPMQGKNIIYTGPYAPVKILPPPILEDRIIAYMGMGTISPKDMVRELTRAFSGTKYKVYIASQQCEPFTNNNIVIDRRFDFSTLLPGATAFINHGGQNSIMTGLQFGVPQIICPGTVFERKYNAQSVKNLGAGKIIPANEFTAQAIMSAVNVFESEPAYRQNALHAGSQLAAFGGASSAVSAMQELLINKK